MFEKAKPARDAFEFSLRGMTTIASFSSVPALADDRIDKIRDDRLSQRAANPEPKPRLWFGRQRRAAQGNCA